MGKPATRALCFATAIALLVWGWGCDDGEPDLSPVPWELTLAPPQVTANVGEDFEVVATLNNRTDDSLRAEFDASEAPVAGSPPGVFSIEHGQVERDVPAGGTVNVAFGGSCLDAGTSDLTVSAIASTADHFAAQRDDASIPITCLDPGGTGGGGTGGTGGLGGAGGGGATVSIPPNTTDCTVDVDGCVVGGSSTCAVVMDGALAASTAHVHIEGSLLDTPAPSAIGITAYAATNGYEWTGYTCKVGEGELHLNDVKGSAVASHTWTAPTGEDPVSLDASFDTGATSGTCTVTAAGAPTTPLQSSAMGTSTLDPMVVTLWNAKVCWIGVSSPP